jgi:hypothetical protein
MSEPMFPDILSRPYSEAAFLRAKAVIPIRNLVAFSIVYDRGNVRIALWSYLDAF